MLKVFSHVDHYVSKAGLRCTSFASYYKNRWDTHPPHTHCGQQLRLLLQEQVGYAPSPYLLWSTASPLQVGYLSVEEVDLNHICTD